MPEPDRRGDVERALPAGFASHPARGRPRGDDEVSEQEVDLDGVTEVRRVARSCEHYELASGLLGERRSSCEGRDRVVLTVDDEHGATDATAKGLGLLRLESRSL